MITYCLQFRFAPGDTIVLTGLVRDLKRTYPEHTFLVDTNHRSLFRHNPYCAIAGTRVATAGAIPVDLNYGQELRNHGRETVHYLAALHRIARERAGLDAPVLLPRGDLHFGPDEDERLVPGRYWAVFAGGKSDMPVKIWDPARWQAVADGLRGLGLGVVQLGTLSPHPVAPGARVVTDCQPVLRGAQVHLGATTLRDTLRIVRDAEGVVCGVSFPMHLAAALEKPCVVVAGGREAWWWEAYCRENRGLWGAEAKIRVPHRYLHTIGLLDCCRHAGCLARNVFPRNNGGRDCARPTPTESAVLPGCLAAVSPAAVLEAIISYHADGTLPPVVVSALEPDDGRRRIHRSEPAAGGGPDPGAAP